MSGPPLSAFAPCALLLAEWGGAAAVVGGVAIVARVHSRFTHDLDIAISLPKGTEAAFLDLTARHGFTFTTADREMFLEGGLLRATSPTGVAVDFMVADDGLYEAAVARATPVEMGNVSLPVATVEDLLLTKLDAGRHRDLDDAISIKDAFGDKLDRKYLSRMGDRFGLRRQLENLLGPLE